MKTYRLKKNKISRYLRNLLDIKVEFFQAIFIFLIVGCNSVFYYPDDKIYYEPDPNLITYDEFYLKSNEESLKKSNLRPIKFEVKKNSQEKDKDLLHVWHFKPDGTPRGTILFFHGNAQNQTSHVRTVIWLVQEGFELISFDYRGYGKSTGKVSRANTVEDGQTMLRYLKKQNPPYFAIGQSLGGAVLLAALNFEKTDLKNIVIDSSFSSYREIARQKLGDFFLTWPLQIPLSFLISDDLSPKNFVDNLAHDITLLHGSADNVVSFEHGEKLASRLAFTSHVRFIPILSGMHTSGFYAEDIRNCVTNIFKNDDLTNSCFPDIPAIIDATSR